MDVDVVVVTYDSASEIDGMLDSVSAALGSLRGRVVVVDNGSGDDTRERVARRDGVTLVAAPNRGYAAGLNRGIAELGGTGPVLLANPDVRLAPGSVETLVRTLRPGVGVVVPLLTEPDGRVARSLRREPTVLRSLGAGDSRMPLLSEIVNEPEAYERPHDVAWATGAVMLLSRACHDALGGLDESFFMYSEETDLCLRARDLGWSTRFEPAAGAVHVGGGSGRSPELYAMQVLNRVRLHRRRHPLPASAAFLALTTLRETVHGLAGDADSRRAVEALVRGRRPSLLPWDGPLLRRSRPLLPGTT